VVDDDAASGELLEEIFAAQGWKTLAAQTPQRARELAAQQKFDLVVSDINLEAGENGLDLLRSLREACPVILVTGFGSLETAIEATHEGAYDFISKPFKVEEPPRGARWEELNTQSARARMKHTKPIKARPKTKSPDVLRR
jgi:two-component system response regulator PilR (NtrC family)